MVCDIDDISIEYKREAVEYWRRLKSRTIESVNSRFRKVISAGQLWRWEKQMNVGSNRIEKLGLISAYILDKFIEAIHRGARIHNIDITRWALQAQ